MTPWDVLTVPLCCAPPARLPVSQANGFYQICVNNHNMLTRRAILAAGSVVSVSGLAGCSGTQQLLGGPDPEVVEVRSGLSENILTGEIDAYVVVANQGTAGDVRVELRVFDEADTVIDRFEQVVEIQEGARRRVDFQIDVLSDADHVEASAEAA